MSSHSEKSPYVLVWEASKRRTVADMRFTTEYLLATHLLSEAEAEEAHAAIDAVMEPVFNTDFDAIEVWCAYDGTPALPHDKDWRKGLGYYLTPVLGQHATYMPASLFLEGIDSRALEAKAMREARIYLTIDGADKFMLTYENMPFYPLPSKGGYHIHGMVIEAAEEYVAYTSGLGYEQQAYTALRESSDTLSVDRYIIDDIVNEFRDQLGEGEVFERNLALAATAVRNYARFSGHPSPEEFTEVVEDAILSA